MYSGNTTLSTTGATKALAGAANMILPSWARTILAVTPMATLDTPTAAQSVIPLCELESNDISIQPFQCLGAPTDAILGASGGGTYVGPNETYVVNCPVTGGEQIAAYLSSLDDNTSAPFGGVELLLSNQTIQEPQRHAKVGTLTSTGTTASSDVAGTRYNFSGAKQIVELQAAVTHSTVATADGVVGYAKFTSNEFDGVSEARMAMNPIGGGLATLQIEMAHLTRRRVKIPVTPGQVNIQDYMNFIAIPATAGQFMTGVVYEIQ
jgi:hypothetical protein